MHKHLKMGTTFLIALAAVLSSAYAVFAESDDVAVAGMPVDCGADSSAIKYKINNGTTYTDTTLPNLFSEYNSYSDTAARGYTAEVQKDCYYSVANKGDGDLIAKSKARSNQITLDLQGHTVTLTNVSIGAKADESNDTYSDWNQPNPTITITDTVGGGKMILNDGRIYASRSCQGVINNKYNYNKPIYATGKIYLTNKVTVVADLIEANGGDISMGGGANITGSIKSTGVNENNVPIGIITFFDEGVYHTDLEPGSIHNTSNGNVYQISGKYTWTQDSNSDQYPYTYIVGAPEYLKDERTDKSQISKDPDKEKEVNKAIKHDIDAGYIHDYDSKLDYIIYNSQYMNYSSEDHNGNFKVTVPLKRNVDGKETRIGTWEHTFHLNTIFSGDSAINVGFFFYNIPEGVLIDEMTTELD